jgi:hypothetical protein
VLFQLAFIATERSRTQHILTSGLKNDIYSKERRVNRLGEHRLRLTAWLYVMWTPWDMEGPGVFFLSLVKAQANRH